MQGWGIWFIASARKSSNQPTAKKISRESRLALESYWYAAHSGSQRSQCKSIQILLVRRMSNNVVFSYSFLHVSSFTCRSYWYAGYQAVDFFCALLVDTIGTPHVFTCRWYAIDCTQHGPTSSKWFPKLDATKSAIASTFQVKCMRWSQKLLCSSSMLLFHT